QIDLAHGSAAGNQEPVRGHDRDAVRPRSGWTRDGRDQRWRCREIDLQHHVGRVVLDEQNHALASICPDQVAWRAYTARDLNGGRRRPEVKPPDLAVVTADVKETAIARHQHTTRIGDRGRGNRGATPQGYPLDVPARELRDIGVAMRL